MTREGRRLPLWLSLALGEVRASRAFAVSFVLSLALGLSGFLTLDAFRRALTAHLDERSRALLGADLTVTGEREPTPDEKAAALAALPPGSETRDETMLLTMAVKGSVERLVQLRAVDERYPFYGTIGLRAAGDGGSGVARALAEAPRAWVYPELLAELGLSPGDSLKIGEETFTVADVVDRDPGVASAGLTIAPTVFVGLRWLPATALLGRGSRVFHSWLVKLPPGSDVVAATKAVKAVVPLRVRPHREASVEVYRALLHLSDYLGLVALVALFLAGVGGAYLFRSFLEKRCKDIAILLSLGLGLGDVRRVYVAQLTLLGLAATVVTAALAALLLPLVPWALGTLMPAGLTPSLSATGLALVLLMGTGGSLLTCLPLLARLGSVQPSALFQEAAAPALDLRPRHALWWLPALGAFWGLACLTARSLFQGSLFAAIFLAAAALLALAGLGLIALAQRRSEGALTGRTPLPLALATLSLARHRTATLASFVALSLGALLVNLIPQIRAVLATELTRPESGKLPSLFLFDIQDEQLQPLVARLTADGARPGEPSALVRARLTRLRGEPVKKAAAEREGEGDEDAQRSLDRGYNLTYRAQLSDSETLVEGRPFSGSHAPGDAGPAEISLEQRFAERLGVRLGDTLTFDVQGVEVEGRVVNLRRVRWTSFQPNFFVQFQPGVLDDAPKTHVMAIPAVDQERKIALEGALAKEFPNVSVVDVGATVTRLLDVVGQMARALAFMAVLSLVAGLAVLFSIARHQALRRLADVTLLKVLGTRFGQLRAAAALEFGLLGLAASALGAALSVGAAFVLSDLLFDRLWAFTWAAPLVVTAALAGVTTVVGLVAVGSSLRASPARLLGQEPG